MESNEKHVLKSKTMQVSIATVLIGVIAMVFGDEWISSYPQVIAGFVVVKGILDAVLRAVTGKPVTTKWSA